MIRCMGVKRSVLAIVKRSNHDGKFERGVFRTIRDTSQIRDDLDVDLEIRKRFMPKSEDDEKELAPSEQV